MFSWWSRLPLSLITAYLEVKICSLVSTWKSNNRKHNTVEKGRYFSWRAMYLFFPQYCRYNFNFRSQIAYLFLECGSNVYINSANLTCRGMDILNLFQREFLGLRDNESWLFFRFIEKGFLSCHTYCCLQLGAGLSGLVRYVTDWWSGRS